MKSTAGVITYEAGVGSGNIPHGWTSAVADATTKEASIDGIALTSGLVIAVTFTNGNSVAAPTLSVNVETARTVQIKNGSLTADMIPANYRALLQYGSRTSGSPTIYWTLLNPASGGGVSGPFTAGDINLLGYSVVGSNNTSLAVATPASAIAATVSNTVLSRPTSGPIAFGKVTPAMLDDPNVTLTSNRVYSSNGEWVALPSGGGGSGIPVTATATDANDATTTGIYTNVTGNTPYAGTATNHTLFVIAGSNGNIQQYDTYNSTSQRGIWVRSKHGTSSSNTTAGTSDLTSEALTAGWTSWRKIAAGGSGGGSGTQGPQGAQGAQGAQGTRGYQGYQGVAGGGGYTLVPPVQTPSDITFDYNHETIIRLTWYGGNVTIDSRKYSVGQRVDVYYYPQGTNWNNPTLTIIDADGNSESPTNLASFLSNNLPLLVKLVRNANTMYLLWAQQAGVTGSGGSGVGGIAQATTDTVQVLKINNVSTLNYTMDLTSVYVATDNHTHVVT